MQRDTLRAVFTPRHTRWLMTAMTIIGLLALAIGSSGTAHAQLSGSTFESNDGNMIVNTTGNKDWVNAPNLTRATDFPSGAKTDNSFTTGSKEDDLNPVVGIAGVPPNKNDLIHFYTANETVDGSSFLYLAFTRAQTSGNADVDFEVNHAYLGTTPTTTDPSVNGSCPTDTTNEYGVCVPLQRTDGDVLFQFIFPGGGGPITALEIWRWAASSSSSFFVPVKNVTNSAGCLSTSSGPPCWSDPTSPSAGQFDGASNTTAITNPLDNNSSLPIATFGEAAINLTATGIFPAGVCSHFGGAWAKSRSSDSGSSALQDVIAPVPTNINNCGTVTIIKHTQPRGLDQEFSYTSNLPADANAGGKAGIGTDGSFILNDKDNTTADSTLNTVTESDVFQGTYTVTEGADPTGFKFASVTCTGGQTGTTTTSTTNKTATIVLAPGDDVTCTYVNNQQLGAIKITKTSSKTAATPLAGAHFEICTNAGPYTTSNPCSAVTGGSDLVTGDGTNNTTKGVVCLDSLAFGTYYVQETAAPSGYKIDTTTPVTATVNANAKCSDTTFAGEALSFTDTPLTDLTVTATSEATGGTQSKITCTGPSPSTSNIGNSPQGFAGSVTVTANGTNSTALVPGTYTCTIVVDP